MQRLRSINVARRSFSTSTRSLAGKKHDSSQRSADNEGKGLPKAAAFDQAFKRGKLEDVRPGYKQDPSESNVTASTPSPRATSDKVEGAPDPNDPDAYVEAKDGLEASAWKHSSTNSAPAHDGLAQQMAKNEQTAELKSENQGFDRSLPPDFNPARMNDGAKWTEEDIKKRTP